jgi:dTDP-4-dehydrorhamnose 3,5-epimerase
MPFTFTPLELDGLMLIQPKVFADARGHFQETYKESDFTIAGMPNKFVQDNQSLSYKNVIRGLHYQMPPYEQGKLVRCVYGEVLDVAVDIRKNSKTYGEWLTVLLSSENNSMIYIPPGFAHGFAVRSDIAIVNYKVTGGEYNHPSERGIIWNDPELDIRWGIDEPIISEQDKKLPLFQDMEEYK